MVEAAPPAPAATATPESATPPAPKAKVPWAEKYGVAGPKMKPLPTPKTKD